jgi:hypothetical protein
VLGVIFLGKSGWVLPLPIKIFSIGIGAGNWYQKFIGIDICTDITNTKTIGNN